MGTWNTKTESIVWEDDDAESQHDNKVREMNGIPIPKKETNNQVVSSEEEDEE